MMFLKWLLPYGLAIALLQLIGGCQGQLDDFCGLANCNGRTHITCNMPDGAFGPDCPSDVHMLNLRDQAQRLILHAHNKYRDDLASGNTPNFEKAAHMGTMLWNVTLANLARRNVRQCKPKIDECRSTPDFNFVGQNVGHVSYDMRTERRSLDDIVYDMVTAWFEQNTLANMDVIKAYKPNRTNGGYNFFAQVGRDFSTRVGCAAAQFGTKGKPFFRTLLLTCNYDLGLVVNFPIYTPTTDEPGSGCLTGINPRYPNLCSENERWNVNKFFLID